MRTNEHIVPSKRPRSAHWLPLVTFILCVGMLAAVQAEPPVVDKPPPKKDEKPEFESEVKTDFYDVEGEKIADIRKALSGRFGSHHAKTDWRINWNYRFVEDDESVRLTKFTAKLKITHFMPKLTPSDDHSAALKTRWQKYHDSLWVHERGHAKHGELCIREVLYRVRGAKLTAKTRDELNEKVNTMCQDIIQKYIDLDAKYDKATRHGVTQGALF